MTPLEMSEVDLSEKDLNHTDVVAIPR